MNRQLLICRLLLLTCALPMLGCSCNKDEATVGAVLPLTGDAAIYGKSIKDGIELAVSEVNAAGGINGKQVRVVYEDDEGKATTAVSATQKLLGHDKPPVIIGGVMSSTCAALGPVCQKKETVLLSTTATNPSLGEIGDYCFFLWPSDLFDGKVMAEYAYNELELRRIAVLYVNLEYGKGVSDIFREEFERLGGKIVANEAYDQGATDFRAQLSKIKALEPDGLYLPGYYKEIAGIFRQARELGLETRFLGANGFYEPKLIEIAGDTVEGAIFTYPTFDPSSDDPKIREFVEKFKERYGKEPDAFAVQGYDAMRLIAHVAETGEYSSKEIRDALGTVEGYPGVGGRITFDKSGFVDKPLRILTVQDGKFVTVTQTR